MNPILEKIQKLLRLGRSSNPHEAELAVQRAYELAAKHQVDIESVNLDDDSRRIIAERIPHGARTSFARKKILNLVVGYFNVSAVIQTVPIAARQLGIARPELVWIGKPVDIAIARYVYDFLHTACARALKVFCAGKSRRPARSTQETFIQGWIYGVGHKLHETELALSIDLRVLISREKQRREKFLDQLFGRGMKPVKAEISGRGNREALLEGFARGKEVKIRKPIASNAAGQQLLAL